MFAYVFECLLQRMCESERKAVAKMEIVLFQFACVDSTQAINEEEK